MAAAKKRKAPVMKAKAQGQMPDARSVLAKLVGDMAGRAIQGAAEALFEHTEEGVKTVLDIVNQAHETIKRPVKRKTKAAQDEDELEGEVVEPAQH